MAAIGSGGEIVGQGDFAAQFRAAYGQLSSALAAEDLAVSNIVHLTTYLVREGDVDEFYAVRAEIYRELFSDPNYPPHVLLIVKRLADPEMLVEIQAVASR
jgi:enamine deaminase RidA (YjgF/YER057c/UK114 family)